MTLALFFQLIVLIFSVMVHEVAHGAMALRLGDDTAQRLGRLTFNPLKHLDPFGSVFLPLLLIITRSPFLIGWAKPVPYDPRNLHNPQQGAALVALAGPASNLALAAIFGAIIRLLSAEAAQQMNVGLINQPLMLLLAAVVYTNLLLAIFNLVPIPPLDGSKLLLYFIPKHHHQWQAAFEKYGPLLLLGFILFGFSLIMPIVGGLFQLLTGHRF